MTFDFDARAEAREQTERAERRRTDEAYRKRCDRASSLNAAFTSFAKHSRFRQNLTSELDGPAVTFRDESKLVEVTVLDPPWFSVVKAIGQINKSKPWDAAAMKVGDDDTLMDILDAWIQEK